MNNGNPWGGSGLVTSIYKPARGHIVISYLPAPSPQVNGAGFSFFQNFWARK